MRLEIGILLAILLVGVALRVGYLAEIRDDPGLVHPSVDAGFNLYWARGLATGDWSLPADAAGRDPRLRETAYQRPPGYPWVLSVLYRITGGSPMGIRAIQMVGGLVSVVLSWWVGRRLVSAFLGLLWAGFMAVHWGFIYFEAGLNGMWLVHPLLLLLILVLHRLLRSARRIDAVVVGVLVGLVALVRSNALMLVPLIGVWILVVLGRRHGLRPALLSLGVAASAGLITISPATIRNYRVSGHFVPISANAGTTLYHGNNPAATGISTAAVGAAGRFSSPWQSAELMARASRDQGRPVDYVETSSRLGRRAREWMADDPGAALRLVGKRAVLFWGPDEMAHSTPVAADRLASPLLRRLPFAFSVALAGFLWGVALLVVVRWGWGGSPLPEGTAEALAAVGLVMAGWFVSFLPFFVTSLYRLPVVPWLLLGAALGMVTTIELVRSERRGAAAIGVGGALLLWLLLRIPVIPVPPGVAERHIMRGSQWRFAGDVRRAEAEFREALQAAPDSTAAQAGLAALLLDSGRVDQALPLLESALEGEPDNPQLHFNLGLGLARTGDWAAAAASFERAMQIAPNLVAAHLLLGTALERAGEHGPAVVAFERALELDPGNLDAANGLAWLLATAPAAEDRDGHRAVSLAERVVAARRDAATLGTLAAALAEAGRYDEAVTVAEEALRADDVAVVSRSGHDERLQLYRSGRPFHQQAPGHAVDAE